MNEPTTDPVASTTEAAGPPAELSRGAKIDELAKRIPARTMRIERIEAELDEVRKRRTEDVSALVDLVGNRQAAATLLDLTGRELASLLPRGSAK